MRKWIIIGVVVAVLAVGGFVVASASSGSNDEEPVLITDTAVVRDLRDEVTVPGTLERAEQRTVNWLGGSGGGSATSAAAGSVVSAVYLSDGAALNPGDAILAVDGRRSVASPGLFPFFRKLDVGAEGSDVLQLKSILAAAGFQPGPDDLRYTEQTRFAVGQWQAAKGYPGASPSTSQTVNVSLQQGSGYQLGPQTSAGLTIGPPPARKAAVRTGGDVGARAEPMVTIGAASTTVKRGTVATFTIISDDEAPAARAPPSRCRSVGRSRRPTGFPRGTRRRSPCRKVRPLRRCRSPSWPTPRHRTSPSPSPSGTLPGLHRRVAVVGHRRRAVHCRTRDDGVGDDEHRAGPVRSS